MKLINRNNLAVTFAASKEKSRYTLQAILATENETVATDGHTMARISLPSVKTECFPSISGFKANGFTHGLIPLDTCKAIENAIPKSKSLTILNHAAISSEFIEAEQRTVLHVAATDLDTPKLLTIRQPDGTFPNWKLPSLWQYGKTPLADITVSAKLLAAIANAATKISDRGTPSLRVRVYGADSAIRFDMVNDDGQEFNSLLMPLRSGSPCSTFMELPEPPATEPSIPAPAGGEWIDGKHVACICTKCSARHWPELPCSEPVGPNIEPRAEPEQFPQAA